ncbi:hypothetical protein HD554DRAFT_2203708 [Boletus coccyginus]|nr:hypothetical protein HD554DRAFT_2203708 [Boletus coccyginus]
MELNLLAGMCHWKNTLRLYSSNNWTSYCNQLEFETAQFLFSQEEMLVKKINTLLHLWGTSLAVHSGALPFANHQDFSHSIGYASDRSGGTAPWIDATYEVHFRDPQQFAWNILKNPDFKDEIDYTPYHEWRSTPVECTTVAVFVPIILRSDKTMVSVATGQNNYYSLYLSIRNVQNSVRHAHYNAVMLIGFLAIAKSMTVPEIMMCTDGYYRKVIYGLGPYIADYEEQVVLAGIVRNWCGQCTRFPWDLDSEYGNRMRRLYEALIKEVDFGTLWDEWGIVRDIMLFMSLFPCSDIHVLLAPNLLHQLIKGTFKDHLVDWMVCTFHAFLEFCFIAQHDIITDDTLEDLEDALKHFHEYHKIFISANHYLELIHLFDTPNGLCSSITESKYIKAVKRPYWRSSKFGTLKQILLTNQQMDKLAALLVNFTARGMLKEHSALTHPRYFDKLHARNIPDLIKELNILELLTLIHCFLYDQLYGNTHQSSADVPLQAMPIYRGHMDVFHSALVTFFASSDPTTPSWQHGAAHYDTVLINVDVLCLFSFPFLGNTFPCTLVHWYKRIGSQPDNSTGLWMLSVIHLNSIFRVVHLLSIFNNSTPIHPVVNLHNSLNAFKGYYMNKFADHHSFEILS